MSKSETEIARENITLPIAQSVMVGKIHKATCQRWLEFIEGQKRWFFNSSRIRQRSVSMIKLDDKITDLKSAIGEYEKNGI